MIPFRRIRFLVLLSCLFNGEAFHLLRNPGQSNRLLPVSPASSLSIDPLLATTKDDDDRPGCYYRSPSTGRWQRRLELSELSIGQELVDAVVVQELLDGRTGPKLFVDCGVGRFKGGKWQIQTAMLRLSDRKKSAAVKRTARLRKKKHFSVFVSRVRLENDQLEVCLRQEDVQQTAGTGTLVSVGTLQKGQECIGTVQRVLDYGVLIDVGANRHGLLHIRRVADLNGCYIDKAEGLVEAGLERGARLRVQVMESVAKKRLFLDFTEDVKELARKEVLESERRQESSLPATAPGTDPYAEYAEMALKYQEEQDGAAQERDDEYDNNDDDEDEYDEDRSIEDALGLGSY